MCYGHLQVDMAAAFTAHLFLGDFNTASVADSTLVTDALVLSAVTFVVLDRAKYFFAEQAVAFRLLCAIVDGLRLGDLAS